MQQEPMGEAGKPEKRPPEGGADKKEKAESRVGRLARNVLIVVFGLALVAVFVMMFVKKCSG